jgi:SagB-type dehydrogenase family enzyme
MHTTWMDDDHLRVVRDYHERTKHQLNRFAASLGYMDWANQPNPFRTFAGTQQIELPLPELRATPTYDGLFTGVPTVRRLDAEFVSRLFYHSLALSAWKQAPGTHPWSLRINPSSGDLHPTEGYWLSGPVPGLIDAPGVFHYAPFGHRLERRCHLSTEAWHALTQDIPSPCALIGLTSIYWRESWKYGERAFRYCHHDVGHAIGAIAVAARTLGWKTRLLPAVADEDLNRLLGTHHQSGVEAEHADCLLLLFPADTDGDPSVPTWAAEGWQGWVPDAAFAGEPNRLSEHHHEWPAIEQVSFASRSARNKGPAELAHRPASRAMPIELLPDRQCAAEQIIRQRRSAVAMDGVTSLDRAVFYQMLQRTLPAQFPFAVLPWLPRVALAIFVHRVDGLDPGLYLLVRDVSHEPALKQSLSPDFEWRVPEGCPRDLQFYRLQAGDAGRAAKVISCYQDIASDGAFSLGMLAEFDAALTQDGPSFYPRLFWETGLIGQVLYLEAEAAGVRSTGIGCFLDDVMHDILGIADRDWQSLYHFTVGGPVEDTRLKTIPPYAHIMRGG